MRSRFLMTLALICAACGGGSGEGNPNGQNPGNNNGASFGLTQRVPVTGLNFPTGQAQPGSVRAADAFPNLNLGGIFLASPPDGSDRLFIVRREGRIEYFTNSPAANALTPFLDISSRVTTAGECGMLSMAFDPDFASNGHYYAFYVTETGGPLRSVVSRFEANAGHRETILLSMEQSGYYHKGGMLAFGPDDMLYISVGDSGPSHIAQNLLLLPGKILRIDPSQTSPGLNYAIPADNPFVGMPFTWDTAGTARGEIWAYGLRNPWRFSFDRGAGALWLGDVGQDTREEVDIIVRGANYGWPHYEGELARSQAGNTNIPTNRRTLDPSTVTGPIFTYGHPSSGERIVGQSVVGGYVYRGTNNPSLTGSYIFTDINGGRNVWAFAYSGSPPTQAQVQANGTPVDLSDVVTIATGIANTPVSFGEDAEGELYTIGLNTGTGGVEVYGFSPNGNPSGPGMPQALSDTGLFTSLASLTPAPGIIEYAVNSPLWSDWAVKRRWIALPGTQQIAFSAAGNWEFPIGTVLVKHFDLTLSAAQTRRLETRVLINTTSGWQGHTYKWNDEQTDAELLTGSDSDAFAFDASAPGGARNQTWNYPSPAQCLICHTAVSGGVLGVRTGQINRDFNYPSVTDNQLRAWNNIGLFASDIGSFSQYGAWADPADEGAPIASRARSYLAANCSQCHAPGGPTPLNIDLRAQTATGQMNVIDQPPQAGDLGLPNARIVARDAGAKENSVLWERLRRLDAARMPPLGTVIADPTGVEVVGEWIDQNAP